MYSRKNKTYEEIYGSIERANEEKRKRILAHLGRKASEETRKKQSILKKGKTYEEIYGVKTAKDLKDIRKKARLGYKLSEETKRKIIDTRRKNGSYVPSNKEKERLRFMHKNSKNTNTSIEIKIQNFLKQLGITFFTHQYIKEIKHGYHCDILIPSMNLVIECDGNYWHKYPIGNEIDKIRTSELINRGFKVLRLWESEIKEMNVEKFKEVIDKCSGG